MRRYYKVMLGRHSCMADECRKEGYIGSGFLASVDLTGMLPDNWRDFNKKYVPIMMKKDTGRTKVAAGLGCGALWTISKGILRGDIVISPTGNKGELYVGEVIGDYYFAKGSEFSQRRKVKWYDQVIMRDDMSEALRNSSGAISTCVELSGYGEEIEKLIGTNRPSQIVATTDDIDDPSAFALEKHLEDFLVKNWANTELGKKYNIFTDQGEMIGQQYPTDTGPIDILAVSKDNKTLLVIELKRGRASDVVVGQIQRYMGYIQEEVLERGQTVKGLIIGLEPDVKLKRAISVCNNIEFRKYEVKFRLLKEE